MPFILFCNVGSLLPVFPLYFILASQSARSILALTARPRSDDSSDWNVNTYILACFYANPPTHFLCDFQKESTYIKNTFLTFLTFHSHDVI